MFVGSLKNDDCSGTLSLAFFFTFKQITDTGLAYTSGSLVFMLMEILLLECVVVVEELKIT